MSARVIAVAVVNGKGHATIARGGMHGVREGWKAHAKLKLGGSVDARVVSVQSNTCKIEVESLQVAQEIGVVELRPASEP